MVRLRAHLPALTLLSTLALAGCGDDPIGMGTDGSSGSGSSTQGETSATTDAPTTSAPTTSAPTTGEPTTGGTSTSTTGGSTSTTTTTTGPGTTTGTDTGTTAGTSTGDSSTGDSSTGDSSGGSSSTGGVMCTPGEVNCDCDNNTCVGSAICAIGKCLPAGDGSCPFEFDLVCDEPEFCDPGSDPFDCCASPQDGVCEEFDFGGECPPYSDFFDCGYCPFVNDGVCDAGLCPQGTDTPDCCATEENGVCEEMSQGGMCPDGTDTYDCGGCPFEDDGECDVPDFCPAGTDLNDCCATPENGVCEEMQAGGQCANGSDPYDCGVCLFEDDGVCDVPDFCPAGTDVNDCCATPKNGVCEEMQAGGQCANGTDPYDCGVCNFEDDGECDVPQFCPEGTDVNDCA